MTVHRNVGFRTRPRSVDRTAPSIVVGSIFAAIVLLTAVQPSPKKLLISKPPVLVPGTAVLPLDARQRHLDVAGQRLPDHLGIEGAEVVADAAQQVTVGGP